MQGLRFSYYAKNGGEKRLNSTASRHSALAACRCVMSIMQQLAAS